MTMAVDLDDLDEGGGDMLINGICLEVVLAVVFGDMDEQDDIDEIDDESSLLLLILFKS
jgi:hypothetical protein